MGKLNPLYLRSGHNRDGEGGGHPSSPPPSHQGMAQHLNASGCGLAVWYSLWKREIGSSNLSAPAKTKSAGNASANNAEIPHLNNLGIFNQLTNAASWPRGKASVLHTGIPGSNPGEATNHIYSWPCRLLVGRRSFKPDNRVRFSAGLPRCGNGRFPGQVS